MRITKEEWERTLAKRHGAENAGKLAAATVAVCGLGGLGASVAQMLVRMGTGKLILADFDRVELSNLHRQAYKFSQIGKYKTEATAENLREINPFAEIETHTVRISEENAGIVLKNADIVCEAFDNPIEKAALCDYVLSKTDKYAVAASGTAGLGAANEIKTEKITERFFLCGDGKSEVNEKNALYASRVTLCAAHQAHAVLRILCGETE